MRKLDILLEQKEKITLSDVSVYHYGIHVLSFAEDLLEFIRKGRVQHMSDAVMLQFQTSLLFDRIRENTSSEAYLSEINKIYKRISLVYSVDSYRRLALSSIEDAIECWWKEYPLKGGKDVIQ